jgi:hypothetical protein
MVNSDRPPMIFLVREVEFFSGTTQIPCGSLLISVRMRAPFAPSMSYGSRAMQERT